MTKNMLNWYCQKWITITGLSRRGHDYFQVSKKLAFIWGRSRFGRLITLLENAEQIMLLAENVREIRVDAPTLNIHACWQCHA